MALQGNAIDYLMYFVETFPLLIYPSASHFRLAKIATKRNKQQRSCALARQLSSPCGKCVCIHRDSLFFYRVCSIPNTRIFYQTSLRKMFIHAHRMSFCLTCKILPII